MATQEVNIFKLVDANGKFKNRIQKDLKLDVEDSLLAVVSIIGAQSSGKSTLLNHMFGTTFEEMDAESGRRRTTNGIWLAKYSLEQGCILVIDTEGSDGREREGNETFARQTAVFSMALSHVVIINMMCTDIGRESGGGWPLLTTACEVMLQRFKGLHQVTLLFVLRDKTDTPLNALKRQILDEMVEILNKMTESQAQAQALLSELFKIEVVTTSHYLVESERKKFKAEVKALRKWIISHTTSYEITSELIPASSFTDYAKKIWNEIKKSKDLDLPSYRIMVAQEYCYRIAEDQCNRFRKDESWIQIKKNVRSGSIIEGFGVEVSDLIRTYRSRYNEVAEFHDRTARSEYRKLLITDLLEIIKPTYLRLVERMRSKTIKNFRKAALNDLRNRGKLKAIKVQDFITEFEDLLEDARIEQANWTDAATQCDGLQQDINFFIGDITEVNTILDNEKMDRKSTWNNIAMCISAGVGLALTVAGSALAPPLAVAGVPAIIIPLVINTFGL